MRLPDLISATSSSSSACGSGFFERGGKLALGETRPARGRDRARVDDELDLRVLQFLQHGGGLRLFVADGEKRALSCGHGRIIGMRRWERKLSSARHARALHF